MSVDASLSFFRGPCQNLVKNFAQEDSVRIGQLLMLHLVTTAIRRFGTKVFTRLLPAKPNAIHSEHEVADGFPGIYISGPSAGPPREPLMR